ncbi:MAG: TPM domain-containing protein [Bacteroidota bacterium]
MPSSISKVESFLTASEEGEIIDAIRAAELNTSGEIRVHLEGHYEGDHFTHAGDIFRFLHMDNTKNSNGVLIYIAVEDRTLVILGDKGINQVVPEHFWNSTKDTILQHFKSGAIKQGLVEGIQEAGKQLKAHFPYDSGDTNEISNEISRS